jgi:hypothetical protein
MLRHSAFLLYPLPPEETIIRSEGPDFLKLFVHSGAALTHSCGRRVPKRHLIELVKMMHRAVAVADRESVRRGNRSADPFFGVAHGGFHVVALRERRRDD